MFRVFLPHSLARVDGGGEGWPASSSQVKVGLTMANRLRTGQGAQPLGS